MIGRLFSRRIRELERENARLAADFRSYLDKDFDALSIAAWAYKLLERYGAKNYVEMLMFHPKGGCLTITVQKCNGETPGTKAARLEKELAALRAKVGEAAE